MDFAEAKNCRIVCAKWSFGVDAYFQNTNFETIKNIYGANNDSDFVLKLPLRLYDIARLYEMDMHPRCVSFGNKLTLEIDDWFGRFGRHRREINALVQNVTNIWRHFEHLEIRRNASYSIRPGRETGPDNNRSRHVVPYGELGNAENLKVIHSLEKEKQAKAGRRCFYSFFNPDQFEIYIPFLEHLTNLKTVTFFLRNRRQLCQILLRIPRISQLERIFMVGNMNYMHASWLNLSTLVFQTCCAKLTFLAGCELQSLEMFLNSNVASLREHTFVKLTELHLSILSGKDLDAMLRLTSSDLNMINFFPKLSILQIRVGSDTLYANTLDTIHRFVDKFPTLCHFSIAGHCIPPDCVTLGHINGRKMLSEGPSGSNRPENRVNNMCIRTFQFECPSHVPLSLMRQFSVLQHIIVAELPGRCRRRVSKSKDRNYIWGLFNLLDDHVRTITFVPATFDDHFEMLFFEPGAITWNRRDKSSRGRKRKHVKCK